MLATLVYDLFTWRKVKIAFFTVMIYAALC
jgi:hypothetical protein